MSNLDEENSYHQSAASNVVEQETWAAKCQVHRDLPSTEFPLQCVSQDSAASQNYDSKIKLSVEFAERGECWVKHVYLYCPGSHWVFQKNHLKLDVTEF
ncbi:hypothetical protein EK904_013684 [Melospiza melodia maxima]|nr:hypothetical protein EK904_013684 [Melospiza melodia maxima]